MLTVFLILIVLACVSMTLYEGLWTNTISIFNAFFAAIIASIYFEPVADFCNEQFPSYTYFWDLLSLWGLFAFALLVLRTTTDSISKTRVRFKLPVDRIGGWLAGGILGCMVCTFFLFAAHTAPLTRNSFGGQFQETPTSNNFFLAPDRQWLGFLQSRSKDAMSTSSPNVFDPNSEFILKYGERRERFSKLPKMRVR